MDTFNDSPRPWVLFEDVPDEIYEELAAKVPTPRRIASGQIVAESEWDLLVTYRQDPGKDLCVCTCYQLARPATQFDTRTRRGH